MLAHMKITKYFNGKMRFRKKAIDICNQSQFSWRDLLIE